MLEVSDAVICITAHCIAQVISSMNVPKKEYSFSFRKISPAVHTKKIPATGL